MKKHFKTLISHPLISGSTIVFVGSFLGNVLNYIFTLLIGGRGLLNTSDYGLYTSLQSFTLLFGIFSNALIVIFAKLSATYTARSNENLITNLVKGSFIFSLGIGVILFSFLMIGIFFIGSFLHIRSYQILVLAYLSILFSILGSFPQGILQGQMRLVFLTVLNNVGIIVKMGLGLFFILLGWRVFGVMTSLVLSSVVVYVVGIMPFTSQLFSPRAKQVDSQIFLREFHVYSFPFFLATVGITIFSSVDIIIVRHIFPPITVGYYAAISLMGKVIFYGLSPIYFVFFPLIAQKVERKERIVGTVLLAIVIILLAAIFMTCIYFIFPRIILQIFFPAQAYKGLVQYLGPYALYITIFSLIMLMHSLLLSLGKITVGYINIAFALFLILALFLFHKNIQQVILDLIFVSAIFFCVQLAFYTFSHIKKIIHPLQPPSL